jgi:hypothetical protein
MGDRLLWALFKNITEVAKNFGLLFFFSIDYALILTKNWFGYDLGDL